MTADRKSWLSLLSRAPADRLSTLWDGLDLTLDVTTLRAPEIGTVMARGRQGASGDAFNLGEITVTRCSVRLDCGAVGHGYVQGRDKSKAALAATIDAAMQTDRAETIQRNVLDPIAHELTHEAETRAARADGTRVDFFTMVRGEN